MAGMRTCTVRFANNSNPSNPEQVKTSHLKRTFCKQSKPNSRQITKIRLDSFISGVAKRRWTWKPCKSAFRASTSWEKKSANWWSKSTSLILIWTPYNQPTIISTYCSARSTCPVTLRQAWPLCSYSEKWFSTVKCMTVFWLSWLLSGYLGSPPKKLFSTNW